MPEINKKTLSLPTVVPAVAIRDVVMFPGMNLPLSVDRQKSVTAMEIALETPGKYILALSQKAAEIEDPKESDIYHFGVLSEITQSLKMPDGTVKVFLQGLVRAKVEPSGNWISNITIP